MPPYAECSTISQRSAAALAAPLTLTVLTLEALTRLLSAAGGKTITIYMVQAAVDAAAPVDVGGRGKLLEVVAWLEWDLAETRA
jgi:hypothetical protein